MYLKNNSYRIIYLFLILGFYRCSVFSKDDFKTFIKKNMPNNCYYEIYKDFNFINLMGLGKQESSQFKNSFILFKENGSHYLKKFIFLNTKGIVEIEMNRISNDNHKIFAGFNHILLKGFLRTDTILYLNNDTMIYNMTYVQERRNSTKIYDTLQYNLSMYNVNGNLNMFAVGLKMAHKDRFMNGVIYKDLIHSHRQEYFYEDLNYKSFFTVKNGKIINRNEYSGVANGATDYLDDGWTQSFVHNGKIFYSILQNYTIVR